VATTFHVFPTHFREFVRCGVPETRDHRVDISARQHGQSTLKTKEIRLEIQPFSEKYTGFDGVGLLGATSCANRDIARPSRLGGGKFNSNPSVD
jgi:hypothetical protein